MPHSHCINKRSFIMASGIVIFLCLVIYGLFGAAYSSVLRNAPQTVNGGDKNYNLNKELQLVHVLFRHGPRTPADTYPKDPFINQSFYPFGWGQLTNDGKRKLFSSGKWLRKRYSEFLGPVYMPDMIHAQSTGVSRTLMSSELVLASLWPPKGTPNEWNKDLNWQPIPVFSEPLDKDTLLLVRTPCPRYHEAVEEVFEKPEVENLLNEYAPIFQQLTKITGLNISTPDDVQSLYSTLRAEEEFGFKLPQWTKSYYPEKLQNMTELSYIFNIYTDELKRIKGGPFLKKMLKEYQLKANNTLSPSRRKMFVYTGHDSTIVNVLSTFNVWEQQMPVYGIMAVFEFYKDQTTDEFGLQIYLKNSTTREPYPLTIPGCDFFCPLGKLLELTENVMPTEDRKECKPRDPTFVSPELGGP